MTDAPNYFFLKLVPCRPTFAFDMTDGEREVMQRHAAYWRRLMGEGRVAVFGPVMDPKGSYGMGVVQATDEEAIREFIAGDPASQINHYEFYPMRAVLPD
jgi:uncharacterized protein YciI